MVIYHQKSIFTDLSTDTPSDLLHIHRRLQSGNHQLAKGLHSLLDQFSKPVFESSPSGGAEWPRRAAPACFRVRGLWGGPGRELAACFWGFSQVTSVPQLEFEDHWEDCWLPHAQASSQTLATLHSALTAHEGKKRSVPQTILLYVCVSPSDHRMEEVN